MNYYYPQQKPSRLPLMLGSIGVLLLAAVVTGWIMVSKVSTEILKYDTSDRLSAALESYKGEHAYYPEDLDAVRAYIGPQGWPDNPYTGLPVIDTCSATFIKDLSPGNVYYEKHYYPNDSASDRVVVGYTIHVFNQTGQDQIYSNPGAGIEAYFDEHEKRTGTR